MAAANLSVLPSFGGGLAPGLTSLALALVGVAIPLLTYVACFSMLEWNYAGREMGEESASMTKRPQADAAADEAKGCTARGLAASRHTPTVRSRAGMVARHSRRRRLSMYRVRKRRSGDAAWRRPHCRRDRGATAGRQHRHLNTRARGKRRASRHRQLSSSYCLQTGSAEVLGAAERIPPPRRFTSRRAGREVRVRPCGPLPGRCTVCRAACWPADRAGPRRTPGGREFAPPAGRGGGNP